MTPDRVAPVKVAASAPPGSPGRPADRRALLRQTLVVLLAVNSGAVDAIGFLVLGGAFTSVMTGNMVLLGVSGAHGDAALARHVGAAILCFITGCALGAAVVGRPKGGDGLWPAAIARALTIELALSVLVLVGWEATGDHRSSTAQLLLLSGNALGLGLQSSAMQRFGVPGLSTTYLTGTLTSVAAHLALREPVRHIGHSASILAGLIFGALMGGLLATHAKGFAPLLSTTVLAIVVLTAHIAWRDRQAH